MSAQVELPDLAAPAERAGFRLHRLEVFNWGTFHERVWKLEPGGDNALLTGEIGSGKSTLVDAVSTLLVAPNRLAYNKAAGAEARERSLRSYVLGYYKSERAESGAATRPVALRDASSYSVLLAHFHNEGYAQEVTLAQVFWFRERQGPPARFYVVADRPLRITEHFAGFGADMTRLKKRLRKLGGIELFDSFPPYASAFRRRFGIGQPQALELFNQTVSMKSVGNLTDFVRRHMLEPFPVEDRVQALIRHFEDLSRAHAAVLRAKDQIGRLRPLVEDCDRHRELAGETAGLRACREALRPYFAGLKSELLRTRLRQLAGRGEKLALKLERLDSRRRGQQAERDELKQAISSQGGDRLQRLKLEQERKQAELEERRERAGRYAELAQAVQLPEARDETAFLANRRVIEASLERDTRKRAELQNRLTEAGVDLRQLRDRHGELVTELDSLRARRSNIPARMLALRERLCRELGLAEEELPFAGELIQVREEERPWEGAIERLLHSFGLSLLVPEEHYAAVARWVDEVHLGGRLVYYRTAAGREQPPPAPGPDSLLRKLELKHDSPFLAWLERELYRRFDYVCCDDLTRFRRERHAITRAGQVKGGGGRHEKDDRHRIDDRSRYVLGWSNEAKIAALERQRETLEGRIQTAAATIAEAEASLRRLEGRRDRFQRLAVFQHFRDLDWRPVAAGIERLEQERRELEAASDVLRALEARLAELEAAITATEQARDELRAEQSRLELRQQQAQEQLAACQALLEAADEALRGRFPRLEAFHREALGEGRLTVESCEQREKDLREWLQARIDALDKRVATLRDRIISAMNDYRRDYPQETREADVAIEAADEYRAMLRALDADDLPRFERRFKALLNENTIREVANFQAQLRKERETIRERIDLINRSLREIDYNPGRYILLEASPNPDPDIRDFRQDLRACIEGALTASDDQAYAEAKFLQVQRIIERFKGREGSAELDRRWTTRVTDVRNWFVFSASERWREDDAEYEHYTDSGGKSGGQKEKLAYTVLAASLAYQFGLAWNERRSRSFRFVVIDEAFGRGSDDSARYGLELFRRLNLQLLIVTPLQKIHIIEPHVASVGYVGNPDGRCSLLRNLTIEEYRAERDARREEHE